MSHAKDKLTAAVNAMPFNVLKGVAIKASSTATDDATIVLDFCLARLAGCMTSADFIAFCEALPEEADWHAAA